MKESNTSKNKSAIFLLDSQPPHWGELVSVLLKIKEYDFMNICVSGISKGTPIQNVIASWLFVMQPYKDKISIVALLIPFTELPELPPEFKDCTVLTTDKKVFVHMGSLNIPVELVPRTLGYHGVFLRTAYRQGRALDWLLSQATHAVKNTPKKLEKMRNTNEKTND